MNHKSLIMLLDEVNEARGVEKYPLDQGELLELIKELEATDVLIYDTIHGEWNIKQ